MVYAETGDVNQKSPYLCEMTENSIQKMKMELKEGEKNE